MVAVIENILRVIAGIIIIGLVSFIAYMILLIWLDGQGEDEFYD